LLLLLIVPLLPEIVIFVTVAFAHLGGCQLSQKDPCLIGSLAPTDVISFALQVCAGFVIAAVGSSYFWLALFYAAIAAWLVACHVFVVRGWRQTSLRLLLGFAVTLIFVFLPYYGPNLAVSILDNANCRPNEGGIGVCMVFGGYVGAPDHSPAHDAITIGRLAPYGALMALAIFVVFAIAVVIAGVVAEPQSDRSDDA
jgi:hypothetical protein